MRKGLIAAALLGGLMLTGCSGMRDGGDTFTAHGESFRIIGISIPHDDMTAASEQVPEGATITNVNSTSADWTSLWGFFGNLFGYHYTAIGGTK